MSLNSVTFASRVLLVVIVLSVVGCAEAERVEQLAVCERTLEDMPQATLLIGSEGTADICNCAVDSIAVVYPDAADRWATYSDDLETRLERRGVLGMIADTSWAQSRGGEMMEFALVQSKVVAACTERLLKEWAQPQEP